MLGKIILSVFVIIVAFLFLQIVEQRISPQHASDLAIEQIKENGSREQMRIEQNSQNYLDIVMYVSTFCLLLMIWLEKIKELFKGLFTEKVESPKTE